MIGLLAAIGDFLPLAVAVAFSPVPVIAIALVLSQPTGPAAGLGFLVGWASGLGALTVLLVFVVGELDFLSFSAGAYVQILIGLLLIAAAVGKWTMRPRGDEEPPVPGWMGSLATASPGRATMFGVVLAANPKNIALAAAAASSIAYRGLWGPVALIAAAIFVALGSLSVAGGVVLRTFGGERGAARVEGVKRFMLRNNTVILMVIFLFLGLKILGDGLSELGS